MTSQKPEDEFFERIGKEAGHDRLRHEAEMIRDQMGLEVFFCETCKVVAGPDSPKALCRAKDCPHPYEPNPEYWESG